MRIGGVGIDAHDGRRVGHQVAVRESPHHELLHVEFVQRPAGPQALAHKLERLGADGVHVLAGLQVRFQHGRRPAGLEDLHQFGRADHLDAQPAHQFDRARVHAAPARGPRREPIT